MKEIIAFLNRTYNHKYRFNMFLITFYIFILSSLIYKTQYYYFDSYQYCKLSQSFGEGVKFTPGLFYGGIRGYFFPFILNLVFRFFNVLYVNYFLAYLIFSSATFSLIITIIIPEKLKSKLNYEVKNLEILIFVFIICLFWCDYFQYPLTDFYSAFCIILSFILIKSKGNHDYLFAGICAAIALNLRPSYLFCYGFILLLMLYNLIRENSWKITTNKGILFLIGSLIIFSPQIYYNSKQVKSYSPFVPNNLSYHGYSDIKLMHLDYGLNAFKYETLKDFETPKITYYVPQEIQVKSKLYKLNSKDEYFEVVMNNPLKVIMIYSLHFMVGVFQGSNQVYINSFNSNFIFYVLLNGVFFYLFSYFLIKNRMLYKQRFFIEALLLVLVSIITVIPTIVETRYFLLFHLFAYFFVVYNIFRLDINELNRIKITKHLFFITTFLIIIYFSFNYFISFAKIES